MKLLCCAAAILCSTIASAETLVYFGTYTTRKDAPSEGIYVSTLDDATGELSQPRVAARLTNPSFVAIHPSGNYLYSVSEVFTDAGKTGGVVAFSINEDGTLNKLNERSTGGPGLATLPSIRPAAALPPRTMAAAAAPVFRSMMTARSARPAHSISTKAAAVLSNDVRKDHMPIRSISTRMERRLLSQILGWIRF